MTVSVKVEGALVPTEFVAVRTTLDVPAEVGVPVMEPVAALRLSPEGSPVAAKEVGLLLAATWKLKATPTAAVTVEALEITGTETVAVCGERVMAGAVKAVRTPLRR